MRSLDSRGTSRGVAIFYMSLGMALYYLLEEGLSRTRLVERLRLEVLRWWSIFLLGENDNSPDDENSDERPEPHNFSREAGIPFSLQELLKEVNNNEEESSQIVELVTKWNSLTSHLGVSMIRLAPQRALDLQEAKGLEFYYVLKGTGEFAQFFAQDEGRRKCTSPISAGDAWTMEPNRPRWISNSGTEDLILLRSSDNAEGGYDKVYAKELFSWRWSN